MHVSGLLKNKMKRENKAMGERFLLQTEGNSLMVSVGVPKKKTARSDIKQISFNSILEISTILNLSNRQTSTLCSKLRKDLGQNMLESNIPTKFKELCTSLEAFYDVKTETFGSGDEEEKRDIVFAKNTSDLVLHILNKRGLDPDSAIIRISIDGGQGFLKCIVNVFDPSEKHSTSDLDDAGVKRSLILALVEAVSESNDNLSKLVATLKLDEVKFKAAFDLKCANAVFGLSSHSGKYACLWCEGECTMHPGEKRTLSSIDSNYQSYLAAGKPSLRMKEYKNCIAPRLLYLDEPGESLLEEIIPLPELHIFIGIVSMFVKVLLSIWPEFETWLDSNYIMYRGYHGIGLDGNNSEKFLSKIWELELRIMSLSEIQPCMRNLLPVLKCLNKFSVLKHKAFGMRIEHGIEEALEDFKASFIDLQVHLREYYSFDLKPSWKVHILVAHLLPFLQHHEFGLGVYAEQAGESAHHHHREKWKRFKRRMNHEDYGPQLKKSVVHFGINNI